MDCVSEVICGGCPKRGQEQEEYREEKFGKVKKTLSFLSAELPWEAPIFIPDNTRRRAAMAFKHHKGKLVFGFNAKASTEIADVEYCPLLTPKLNKVLPVLRELLQEICAEPYQMKKGKKIISQYIVGGDVWLCEAANGVDVVLEYDAPLELNHRMIIFEKISAADEIIRVSHRRRASDSAEPIIEKAKPYIKIGKFDVFIPAGTFLQPSKEGEEALTSIVKKYLGDSRGKIFDLFCGVGTFSYILAENKENKITAVDSSEELLKGFKDSLNRNQISNVEVMARNLFKYPLDEKELKGADVVVFDPPRAGAAAQVAMLCKVRPKKIIAISCNPATFANDAKKLLEAGYGLDSITVVDQFVYSDHNELVALFTNKE